MTNWAQDEFAAASLSDKRLTLRLIKLATRFAEQPTASTPGASGGAAETKAAYRFFDQANEDQRELGGAHPAAAHAKHDGAHACASCGVVHPGHNRAWTSMDKTLPGWARCHMKRNAACTCTQPMPSPRSENPWGSLTLGCGHVSPRLRMERAPVFAKACA